MLRATMDGNRLIGKVNPRHRVCYLPHNGKEVMTVKMTMVVIPGPAVSISRSWIMMFCSGSSLLILSACPSILHLLHRVPGKNKIVIS